MHGLKTDEVRFSATRDYRFGMVLLGCAGYLAVVSLVASMGRGSTGLYGAFIGVGIALYAIYPVYLVQRDALIFQYGLSKKSYPFAQWTFTVERYSGLASYTRTLRGNSYGLLCSNGKKSRSIPITASDEDFSRMIALLRSRGARVTGAIPPS